MLISTEIKKTFSRARILGSGDDRVALSGGELYCLLDQCCRDLKISNKISGLPPVPFSAPNENYYLLPAEWFQTEHENCPSDHELLKALATCAECCSDFSLYFSNLAELHKRRRKYQNILSSQPRPTMQQIGARSLLEFGSVGNKILASWLVWRKWIFDIDNRAAQETGYLFEPVLASCLGGESISATHSPVRRLNSQGEATGEGRQIDCFDGENQIAYEFKLRVTNAASGQGRFAEELSFPVECQMAGLTPVLIVLDSSPSPRLAELSAKFSESGGKCYAGVAAWEHMESKAGKTMSVFLEKYIRPPLLEMVRHEHGEPSPIQLSWTENSITIRGEDEDIHIKRENHGTTKSLHRNQKGCDETTPPPPMSQTNP
jgi:hypothetical protein